MFTCEETVKKYNNQKNDLVLLLILLVLGIIIFFFFGQNRGYVLYKDSYAYLYTNYRLAGYYGIMPGYCFLVEIVRALFGEENYLNILVCGQSTFAIVILIEFAFFIRREFKLNRVETVIVFILSVLPYCYSLPEEMATRAIMTESVSFSFFYVFMIHMLKGIFKNSYINMAYAALCSMIMILIRKQHIILLAIVCVVIAYNLLGKNINRRGLCTIIILFAIMLVTTVVFVAYMFVYPSKNNMAFDQLTYSLAGKTIYMAQNEDANIFSSIDEREVFELLYDYADQEKMLYSYADSSDMLRWQHAIKGINFTTRSVWKNVITYCRNNGYEDDMTMYFMKDIVCKLILAHPLKFIKVTLIPMGQSLISSVFIKPDRIYNLCALLSAIIYLASFIICYFSGKCEVKEKRGIYMYILILFILLSNVVALNILFQSLQRYVVYTFGLFYIAVFINIVNIYRSENELENMS